MEPLVIQNTVEILAPLGEVWDALTNPARTKQYMFGCEAVSEWKTGSPLLWKMMHDGKELIAVKGNIVSIEPPKTLSYTVFDPNSTLPDVPANYLTVTYQLSFEGGRTILNVTQGDYNKVADGERRFQESYNNGEGWNPILAEIKKMVEGS